MEAVIVDSNGGVLALLSEGGAREVEVAGAIAADGAPVNRRAYRVSASRRNLERARRSDAQYARRHEYRGAVFYTVDT